MKKNILNDNISLIELLKKAKKSELLSLAKIIGAPIHSPSAIESKIKLLYSFFKEDYKIILCGVCKKLNIDYKYSSSEIELEVLIAKRIFKDFFSKMSINQRKNFQNEILKGDFEQSIKSKIKIVGIFSFLTTAQFSGFSIYLLASTTLGIITKTLGFSLPFLFYSSLSSVIAIAIGPIGWTIAGIYSFNKLNEPDFNKLILAILFILNLRIKKYINDKA